MVFGFQSEALGLLLVGVLFGLRLIYKGFKLRRQRVFISNTPTSTIQSIAMGPVEIKGTATNPDSDAVLSAPITGRDCLLAQYEVEEYDENDRSWRTRSEGLESEWFNVTDETGDVLVYPTGATVEASDRNTRQRVVQESSVAPTQIQEFIDRRPDVYPGDGDKRRYTEKLIRPGDEVYVYGTAQSPHIESHGPSGEVDMLIANGTDDEMFFISDKPESQLIGSRKWELLWRIPVGAVLSAVSLGLLLWWLTGF